MKGDKGTSSHRQILKSTGIIGGEQAVVVLTGIARSKILALLLGPAGLGIAGLYQSGLDIVRNATGFGIGFSAVRDVAESAGSNDAGRISRTVFVLRRWVWATGLLGMIVVLLLAGRLSRYTFGDTKHTWAFVLLSVTILLGSISAGQLALLQGLRRIAALAKANALGAILGLIAAIPLYLVFGIEGVVYAMVLASVIALAISWSYAAKVRIPASRLSIKDTFKEGLRMARLGFFMVLTLTLSTGMTYLLRLIIIRKMNLDGVGQFQAAWAISTIYLATILNAMGADYFPRISAVNSDDVQVNRLINEQTEITLLIASPLIIGMLCFSWLLIYTFYSTGFTAAITILEWQVLGTFVKIIVWPLGFVYLAKNKVGLFVAQEVLWNFLYLAVVWFGWDRFGIQVTGIAFLVAYAACAVFAYVAMRRMTGFTWSARNVQLLMVFGVLTAVGFAAHHVPRGWAASLGGIAVTGLSAYISYHYLKAVVSVREVFRKFKRQ